MKWIGEGPRGIDVVGGPFRGDALPVMLGQGRVTTRVS